MRVYVTEISQGEGGGYDLCVDTPVEMILVIEVIAVI